MSRQSLTWNYSKAVLAGVDLYDVIKKEVMVDAPNSTGFKIWGFTLVSDVPVVIETAEHGKIGTLNIFGSNVAYMPTNQNGQGGVVTKMKIDKAASVNVNVFYDIV